MTQPDQRDGNTVCERRNGFCQRCGYRACMAKPDTEAPNQTDGVAGLVEKMLAAPKINLAYPGLSGWRVVGFKMTATDAGLSDGLFALEDLLSRLQAAEARAERGWQDIATAPRDGTLILVFAPGEHPQHHWTGSLGDLISVCAWHPDAGFCVCELREPTHWMPLPYPPALKETER